MIMIVIIIIIIIKAGKHRNLLAFFFCRISLQFFLSASSTRRPKGRDKAPIRQAQLSRCRSGLRGREIAPFYGSMFKAFVSFKIIMTALRHGEGQINHEKFVPWLKKSIIFIIIENYPFIMTWHCEVVSIYEGQKHYDNPQIPAIWTTTKNNMIEFI